MTAAPISLFNPRWAQCPVGRSAPTLLRLRLLALIVLILCQLPSVQAEQGSRSDVPSSGVKESKRVLILMEEDVTWPAFRLINDNLQSTLRRGTPEGIVVFAEHLDLAHFADPVVRAEQGTLVQRKYANTSLDLVITVGDVPLGLFPRVPLLVLSADPSRRLPDANQLPNLAGRLWVTLNAEGTLELAQRLQPTARRIVAIGDGSGGSGASVIGELQAAHPDSVGKLPIKYLTDGSVSAICDEVGKLGRDSIVIYTAMSKDEHGHALIPADVLARIAAKSTAPVYVVVDSMIGTGAVGGYVTSFARIGEMGGELGLRVLAGERPNDVVVPNVNMFDWRQLQRWGISESVLPVGSVVLDRSPNAWDLHAGYIAACAVLLLAAACFAFTFLWQRSKRENAERVLVTSKSELAKSGAELIESEERFRLMANSAPVLMWVSGTDKLCTFFNQAWLEFTGRPMEAELGSGWTAGVHPDDLDTCLKTYSEAFDQRKDFRMEYRLRHNDGEYHWIVDIGVPRFGAAGIFMGYIGSCVDITERKSSEKSLEELSGRLIAGQEAERARIARDLHDDFSQRLALLSIGLGRLWKKRPESEEDQRALTRDLWEQTKEISSDVHRLSHQLHSSKLEHVGLTPTLKGLCDELSEKYMIRMEFREYGVPTEIPKDVALCLFRIAQEALSNVAKYSQAAQAQVELRHAPNETQLRIADAGVGFDPALKRADAGIGLVSMRERLRLVGGALSVQSALGAGTEIRATVPLPAAAKRMIASAQTSGG
jgi:PAS domain S-box-containing protein